ATLALHDALPISAAGSWAPDHTDDPRSSAASDGPGRVADGSGFSATRGSVGAGQYADTDGSRGVANIDSTRRTSDSGRASRATTSDGPGRVADGGGSSGAHGSVDASHFTDTN